MSTAPTAVPVEPSRNYVAGFLFRNSGAEVALIRKNRPEWQRGHLNGIGGKIENGETPIVAMQRESFEEAGLVAAEWRHFCVLKWRGGEVHFFAAEGDLMLHSKTDECVDWYLVADLSTKPILKNLRWLIPMALDPDCRSAVVNDPT